MYLLRFSSKLYYVGDIREDIFDYLKVIIKEITVQIKKLQLCYNIDYTLKKDKDSEKNKSII